MRSSELVESRSLEFLRSMSVRCVSSTASPCQLAMLSISPRKPEFLDGERREFLDGEREPGGVGGCEFSRLDVPMIPLKQPQDILKFSLMLRCVSSFRGTCDRRP